MGVVRMIERQDGGLVGSNLNCGRAWFMIATGCVALAGGRGRDT